MQLALHIFGHVFLPGIIAKLFFKKNWKRAWIIMVATILVDLDHLVANPIFDPNRCSIGFHPLHTEYAIVIYILLLFFKKSRIIGLGVIIHMLTDGQDCFWMNY